MSIKCQTVINLIERFAPKSLAEEWDNIGLQVGSPLEDISGVMVALDISDSVIEEAKAKGANLIVSHHPLIFKPLKNIRADLPAGKLITKVIRNSINIYCTHTNLDSALNGVNQTLAELIGLENIQVLNPDKYEKLYKFVVFVPESHAEKVREAITNSGAGWIGNYSECSFMTQGTGTFKALEGCNPYIGKIGKTEFVKEVRIETIVKENQIEKVTKAMFKAHPYEEVAYDVYPLANNINKLGLGRIGTLPETMTLEKFMSKVKEVLGVNYLRYTGESESLVSKVAVCGGSGASMIHKSVSAGADVLLTGDVKYHEGQDADALGIKIVDAGHFFTERPVVSKIASLLENALKEAGYSVPVYVSVENKDCFSYF